MTHVFAVAMDVEKSLLEQKISSVMKTDSTSAKDLLGWLLGETGRHHERIQEAKKE